jgi:uncharacterized membrane protein YphA (DoxX/SURF4 family)
MHGLALALFVARVYVGAFFFLAGLRKLTATRESWAGMAKSLGLADWFRDTFPWGQLVFGLFLACGLVVPLDAAVLAVMMLGAFVLVHCPSTWREHPKCFGTGLWVNLGMSVELAFVVILAILGAAYA